MKIELLPSLLKAGLIGSITFALQADGSQQLSVPELARVADALTLIVKQQGAPRPPCTYFADVDFMQAASAVLAITKNLPIIALGSYVGWRALNVLRQGVTLLVESYDQDDEKACVRRRKGILQCTAGIAACLGALSIIGHSNSIISPFIG